MATSRKLTLPKKSSLKPKKAGDKIRTENLSVPSSPVFMILAGEHSGDLLGAEVLKELKKHDPELTFFGIGGPRMLEEGFDSIENMEELSVIGFTAVLFKYKFLKALMDRLVEEAVARSCTHAILVDYPGFNLRLAARLKELGIKVIFYVSPQLWAWNFGRIYQIKETIDLMLVLFPFEKKIYDDYGVRSVFVGHPIAQRIKEKIRKEAQIPVDEKQLAHLQTITLMPGSRTGEIHRMLDTLLKSAALIHQEAEAEKKHVRFLIPNINLKEEEFIQTKIKETEEAYPGIKIEYLFDRSLRCIEASDIVLVTSGTATLEVVYFEKPMVILYKVSLLSYFISAFLIRTPFIGLVNILSGRETVKELIQAECTPEETVRETMAILKNKKYRNQMIEEIRSVKESLGEEHSSKNASKAILQFLKEKPVATL
ncbi:lipid-A-disaccharide synthase [Leptospira hartskeerlii]|uniref:Lipid-A-disaccharide synthase n=1 Tax=Leptospira hartskeerlii TaxID=2023177 RepID=A0A2M9X9G0_9LEPT|nr:lipid-A-disaccharide synthase [Leptospira hartskeerlii]PJZ24331.1 lipid-A-disaccharide synthase [Leptospira hartskeerlii]PJZ32516.1 lipid-A-disaccharide synthase [Leptospira hartskeerlii]